MCHVLPWLLVTTGNGRIAFVAVDLNSKCFISEIVVFTDLLDDCFRIIERHAYKVVEDLGRRFNFVYAFMHCNNNALDQWVALTAGGKELEGRVGQGDGQFSLKQDARTVIFYSATVKKGVVYAYPEIYEGEAGFKNAIWDRKGDNKLYFRPTVGKKYKMGDGFEFRLQVIPFSAEPDDWQGKAKKLAEQG